MAQIIPYDERDGVLWFNGELVPWRDAKTHVLTHGLHYASCVFEGERAYSGTIFKLHEHTARLFYSAKVLGIKIPFSQAEINQACLDVLEAHGLKDAYIRPVAFRGSEMMAVSAQNTKIHVAVAAWQWPSYFDPEQKLKGIRLDISKWRRPAPDTAPTDAKAAGLYMICTLSKHNAEANGYADSLMLDYRGYVAEATGANIFFVDDGKLHTPKPDCFLDGITRRTVIDLARRRQIDVVERHIEPEEMTTFEECFITGSAAEVTAVSEIGPYRFAPGKITQALMTDYAEEVRRPVRAEEPVSASA